MKQAVETAMALWVAMQNPGSQRHDALGLWKSWGPEARCFVKIPATYEQTSVSFAYTRIFSYLFNKIYIQMYYLISYLIVLLYIEP